ncbi:Hemicentin-1 [Desmophyllum pertusum]|uniref:Hemicentin-1 n=1 Tax=Desmophyllum pertusum TaxID=174260 RepID=A0A9W9ZW62_9CNID|nr:Hemicentin-1 [Desmophyllum pertusum]
MVIGANGTYGVSVLRQSVVYKQGRENALIQSQHMVENACNETRAVVRECSNMSSCHDVPVRLNGADIEYGGRVEVFYKGKWGKICRNEWDFNDVKVICRQLGFKGALAEFIGSDVKDEGHPFVMSGVTCTGDESELASCARIDGKLNIDCQNDDEGAQYCANQVKNKEVLEKKQLEFNIDASETVSCSIQNKTNFIKWFVNNKEVNSTSGTRIRVTENGKLFIDKVQLSDGGIYECRRLEYAKYYTIYINARFSEKAPKQSLIVDTSGIINCSAEGTPSPLISWNKQDGVLMYKPKGRFRQFSNGSLHVDPVHPGDNGTYICTMKQYKGTDRVTSTPQTIKVSVIIPPNVQLLGPNKPIREGDSVNLTCKINKGFPKPQISWSKDGTERKEKSTTLILTGVKDEDEGMYTCKAENAGGAFRHSYSKYVTVDVPPKVNPELRNRSVELNSTLTMTCFVRGAPLPKVNWTKNGVGLGNNNNTFTIEHVTFKHAGLYGCAAVNRVGKTHTTFWINITVSPQVYVSPRNQSVPEGYPTNFTCKATGIPKPTLSWNFNDGDLPSGVSQSDTKEGSFLELLNTTKSMEGTYKCTAKNKANATTSSAILRVFENPTAKISPNPYPTLTVGDELRLTCKVNEATLEIKWKKNSDPISHRARIDTRVDEKWSNFFIEEVVGGDSGKYSCEARNKPGIVAHSTVKIDVKDSNARPAVEWYYIVGPMSACIVIFLVGWYIRKRQRAAMPKFPSKEQDIEMELLNVEVDEWEIAFDRILLQEVIGRGAFGAVWRALLSQPDGKPGNCTVAAKCFTPTSGEDGRKSLTREIELGKLLGENPQPNIFIRYWSWNTWHAVTCWLSEKSRGIHDKYHLGQGSVQKLETYDLVLFAKQIAAGMVYLGSRGVSEHVPKITLRQNSFKNSNFPNSIRILHVGHCGCFTYTLF